LAGLVLVLIVPLSLGAFSRLLANFFVLDLPEQIYHVSWISMWCAATVMETLRATSMNAHLRFEDYRLAVQRFRDAWNIDAVEETAEWYEKASGWLTLLLGVAAAVAVWHLFMDACIARTAGDRSPSWAKFVGEIASDEEARQAVAALCWQKAIAGLLTTLVLLGVLNGLMIWLRARRKHLRTTNPAAEDQPPWQRSLYALLHFLMGPGYFEEEQGDDPRQPTTLRLAPGHFRLVLYTVTFLTWYMVNYVSAGEQRMPTETSAYSALFYGLLSLLLLLYVLPGFAFYWDRYRIPVPLIVVGAVVFFYSAFGTDHYYELNPAPRQATNYNPPRLEEVYDSWTFREDKEGKRTLVVVDASGGGIQASAWTAQVLTGLDERYGEPFSRSIGLISSVSGGSVGTMFYLINRADIEVDGDRATPSDRVLSNEAIEQIRDVSRASALEATAWGIAYPDTMRAIFPPAVDETIDRGWAIEQVWRQRMRSPDTRQTDRSNLRLSDLGKAIRQNQLPIPVFNATLMESGQRLLISPVLSPEGSFTEQSAGAVEFLREFPDAEPRISTAARLSATFPYVSPAARSDSNSSAHVAGYHVVDGAYVDNEGAVTSVDWINRLITYYNRGDKIFDRPFDRVLLIRIQAFPKEISAESGRLPPSSPGWRTALLGPLDAMMRVRSASQTERGDLEIDLLTKVTRANVDATRARYAEASAEVLQEALPQMALPDEEPEAGELSAAELARQQSRARSERQMIEGMQETFEDTIEKVAELEVVQVMFDFHSPEDVLIPLSWKLTESQKQNIDRAWQLLIDGEHPHKPLETLDRFFEQAERQPKKLAETP
jgi:hypothetical protein